MLSLDMKEMGQCITGTSGMPRFGAAMSPPVVRG